MVLTTISVSLSDRISASNAALNGGGNLTVAVTVIGTRTFRPIPQSPIASHVIN